MILEHFLKENKGKINVYQLKESEWEKLISEIQEEFRLCYITDDDLLEKSCNLGVNPSEFLEKYILPDRPSIISGDFGEILSYLVVKENSQSKNFQLTGPRKWRWKDRNKASQYSDIILFHFANTEKYSNDDLLVTVESKMKATPSKRHKIQEAIDGATQDHLTRTTLTLLWLEEKYARMGLKRKRQMVERFKDPATYGSFKILHKAFAIIDKELVQEELLKEYKNPKEIKIIVMALKDLKEIYQKLELA